MRAFAARIRNSVTLRSSTAAAASISCFNTSSIRTVRFVEPIPCITSAIPCVAQQKLRGAPRGAPWRLCIQNRRATHRRSPRAAVRCPIRARYRTPESVASSRGVFVDENHRLPILLPQAAERPPQETCFLLGGTEETRSVFAYRNRTPAPELVQDSQHRRREESPMNRGQTRRIAGYWRPFQTFSLTACLIIGTTLTSKEAYAECSLQECLDSCESEYSSELSGCMSNLLKAGGAGGLGGALGGALGGPISPIAVILAALAGAAVGLVAGLDQFADCLQDANASYQACRASCTTVCGDGCCEGGETCENCCSDCGLCPDVPQCASNFK